MFRTHCESLAWSPARFPVAATRRTLGSCWPARRAACVTSGSRCTTARWPAWAGRRTSWTSTAWTAGSRSARWSSSCGQTRPRAFKHGNAATRYGENFFGFFAICFLLRFYSRKPPDSIGVNLRNIPFTKGYSRDSFVLFIDFKSPIWSFSYVLNVKLKRGCFVTVNVTYILSLSQFVDMIIS